MHVLVTGAAGFSGAEITRALLASGYQVTAVVGSKRGRLPETVERLGSLEIAMGDLSDDLLLPDGVDAIVHAAARSPLPGVSADDLVRDNVLATRRLVRHARRASVPIFIYLSTISVYGRIDLVRFIVGLLSREWSGADVVTLGAAGQAPVQHVVRLLVDAFGGRSAISRSLSAKPSFLVSSKRASDRYGYKPMEITEMIQRFASENRLEAPSARC